MTLSSRFHQKSKRILLGQLAANGDCLYATAIARQIKSDYPDCHLTWAIGSMCRPILSGNPYVDEIWEVPMISHAEMFDAWQKFEHEAKEYQRQGKFDEIFLTQISPNNFQNFDGTVRLSIFRGYPHPITVPIDPVLTLLPSEIENVKQFANIHSLIDRSHVILFECSSKSGQSYVTPDFAVEVAKGIITRIPDICVILSSNILIQSNEPKIIDGSNLSFRENAELTKYCSLLIGCSSGISWLCTSEWAKPIPKIQLLLGSTSVFASMVHDFEHWGRSTESVLEMVDALAEHVIQCVCTVVNQGFPEARRLFHQPIQLDFTFYCSLLQQNILRNGEYAKALYSVLYVVERYGFHPQIQSFLAAEILPKLDHHLLSNQLEKTQAQLEKTQAQLEKTQAQLEKTQAQLEKTRIARVIPDLIHILKKYLPSRLVRAIQEIKNRRNTLVLDQKVRSKNLLLPLEYYQTTLDLTSPPKISIITPSYNQARYIRHTIDSILNQEYPCLEYIIQDGQSTDETQDILENLKDKIFRVISEPDSGQANAINRGFSQTTGEIMGWLNSDDILLPGSLNYVAQFFYKHPEVDVVYGHRILINEENREIGRWVLPPHQDEILSWADYIPQETMFWRREIWDAAGGYLDESFRFALDWDLILRFRDQGAKFVRLPRFIGGFRVHSQQKTSAWNAIGKDEMDKLRLRVNHRDISELEVSQRTKSYQRDAWFHYWLSKVNLKLRRVI